MAQKVSGSSMSMVQLSLRLRRVTKTKQWELFQRVMLVIVLIIWFTTLMTSVFFRLTSASEAGATFAGESATTSPFLARTRKLAWVVERCRSEDETIIRRSDSDSLSVDGSILLRSERA